MNIKRLYATLVVLLGFVLALLFVDIDTVSPGDGVVEKGAGKVNIVAPSQGVVQNLVDTVGEKVNKDQVLFDISDLEVNKRLLALKNELSVTTDHINKLNKELKCLNGFSEFNEGIFCEGFDSALISSLVAESELTKTQLQQYRFNIEFVESELKNLKRKEYILGEKNKILKRTKAPKMEILNQELVINELDNSLIEKRRNKADIEMKSKLALEEFMFKIKSTINDLSEELRSSDLERVKTSGDINLLASKSDFNHIKSPADGIILSMDGHISNGSFVEKGTKILTLDLTNKEKSIGGRFSSKYRSFIHVGMNIKGVVLASGERKVFFGKIKTITSDSFKYDENNESNRYYGVDVTVLPRYSSVLHEGMNVSLFAVSDNVSLLRYLLGVLYQPISFNVG